ncbi:flagellar basal-body rod protein FlgF [Bartonella sp. M0177]|uniref:flagellar basal-body rod protein FlgF n=1 Tax=Bartonella sp. M0177 TaxID=2750940 RepID=UPI0018DB784F|nr:MULTISPECIES: flagellar basal-body rod protein FlgF [Bartonella]MBI0002916.1 flagellar basal-body rod protein FlgF [Bartonella sp. M0177]WLT08945.1 flagellar basal-body rod protein FlgF [Bartonella apihabitans]
MMQNPIYVGVSGQISLERRMETIARNMANVNTTGFRSEEMKFESLVSPVARDNNQNVNFSSAGKTYISTNRGPVTQTGNPLDVAVNGDSYFSLQTPNGQVYTRDGRMVMTQEGGLVSVQGYPFLDNGGAPIQIDPANGSPRIAADGAIYQNNLQVAAIGLYQFQPDSKLHYGPNASVIPDKAPIPVQGDAANGVVQGFLENSNVNGVVEMTRLIEVSRAFERVEAMMRQQEERSSQAIQTLGGKNQ